MENENIHIIFETVSGSHLYGTNIKTSDHDYRGVAFPPFETFFGNQKFEQLESKNPDRTIFNVVKFVKLAADANPNILELLYTPRKHWLRESEWWLRLYDCRHLFLTRKARHTFTGYAAAQLHKIKNYKAWVDNPIKEPCRKDYGLPIDSKMNAQQIEAMRKLPAGVLTDEMAAYVQLESKYATDMNIWTKYRKWVKTRNPDRAELEASHGYDVKHGMHLVRLLRMGQEAFLYKDLRVDRRGYDAEELVDIRNGAWSYDQLIEYAELMEHSIEALEKVSGLPFSPDWNQIDSLVMNLLADFYGIDLEKACNAIHIANEFGTYKKIGSQ